MLSVLAHILRTSEDEAVIQPDISIADFAFCRLSQPDTQISLTLLQSKNWHAETCVPLRA